VPAVLDFEALAGQFFGIHADGRNNRLGFWPRLWPWFFYGRLKRSRSFPPETSLGALNEGGDVKGGTKMDKWLWNVV
jgi:hypothetical protein